MGPTKQLRRVIFTTPFYNEAILFSPYHRRGNAAPEDGAPKDVAPVVLVVGDAAQAGVKRQHEADNLDEGAQEQGVTPAPPTLHVQLDIYQREGK